MPGSTPYFPVGWEDAPYNQPKSYGGIDVFGKDPGNPYAGGQNPNGVNFGVPGGPGSGGNWTSGGPDYNRGSYTPPPLEQQTGVPPIPDQKGTITVDTPDSRNKAEKLWDWFKANVKFSAGGFGMKDLIELLAKGYTAYEVYKAVTGDEPPKDIPGGIPGKGGKGGGGGGGGKGKYTLPTSTPAYQGLNYQPTFLAWQPTNAGAPVFTSGGPSSLQGTPMPTPPPVTKKKKKAGA